MSQHTSERWKALRTDESRLVEAALRKEFDRADAYRYNSASIRVRVIDPRFEGMSTEERDSLVEEVLQSLPQETLADIISIITLTEEEATNSTLRPYLLNVEFEDPSPSSL